jgi:hypothetical protein
MAYIGKAPGGTGVRQRYLYTATSSQTTFTTSDSGLALSYSDTNYMDVYQNGVLLDPANDYTATSGTSVVLGTGATTGDVIEIIVYDVFSVFNNTVTGNFTVGNNLTVSGTSTLATVDINAGNIDGTTIGAATPAAGTFTTLTASGDVNFDSNTLFVDSSANAVGIGTSSPQGDGLHIKVPDDGTGVVLSGTTSTAGTEVRLSALNEAASAWHNLNIGSNTTIFRTAGTTAMTIDSSQNVGIGTSSPSTSLDVVRNGVQPLRVQSTSGTEVAINMVNTGGNVQLEAHNGKFNMDADGVGINVTNPSCTLNASTTALQLYQNSTAGAGVRLTSSTTDFEIVAGDNATYVYNTSSDPIFFGTNDTTAMTIDSSQNVGIGTSSPSQKLTVQSGTSSSPAVNLLGAGPSQGWLRLGNNADIKGGDDYLGMTFTVGASERMRIDSSGRVGIGTSSPSSKGNGAPLTVDRTQSGDLLHLEGAGDVHLRIGESGNNMYLNANNGNAVIEFQTNGTERMRIDSSGNLLVGTTDTSLFSNNNDANGEGMAYRNGATLDVARYQGECMILNRMNNDGSIVEFRKDGSTVGSIGTYLGDAYVGTGAAGLRFYDAGPAVSPHNTTTNVGTDATVDLGTSAGRFKDLYLSGSVYLGGTGSANALDDYEEGTWTPDVKLVSSGSSTYSSRSGQYTKIGNLCTVTCVIHTTAHSGSGTAYIHGLPFAHASSSESIGSCQMNAHSDSHSTDIGSINSIIQSGESVMHMRATYNTNASGPLYIQLQNFTYLRITITYRTA